MHCYLQHTNLEQTKLFLCGTGALEDNSVILVNMDQALPTPMGFLRDTKCGSAMRLTISLPCNLG